MIQVRDLGVRFGAVAVLSELSFELAPGRSLALWGENGAGKTTAIRAMLGLLPYSGEVRIAGHDARRQGRAARSAMGYVPQQLAFYEDMSALGFLDFIGRLRRAPSGQALALLDRVALTEHAEKAVGALSGGMKQRLALAAALLADPPALLLDEPTANLDAGARKDFLALLAELRAGGKTLLVTSHRLEEVAALADRVIVLDHGRVALDCAAGDLEAALYPEVTLRLVVAGDRVAPALAALAQAGYQAQANGGGLRVRVAPGRRAEPVAILLRAQVEVEDLSLEEGGWTTG